MEEKHLLADDQYADGEEDEVDGEEIVRTRSPVVEKDVAFRDVLALQEASHEIGVTPIGVEPVEVQKRCE